MICPSCRRENPPDNSFCGGCGAALSEPRAEAGRAGARPSPETRPDPRAYTPRHLAEKILASKSALEGERKQVTVLFADVSGSMEMAERVIHSRSDEATNRRSDEGDGAGLLLVGGTPLYFQALFHGMFEGPPADPGFREELTALSTTELQARLARVDPAAATRIHVNDRKRPTRALEVHRATGQPISALQTQWESTTPRYPSIRFGLAWPREELNRRINARAKQMIAAGWLDEVRGLLNRHGDFSPTAAEAAGYGLLAEVVRGRMPLEDAVEQIKIRTRQLAKRQMTWFRRFRDVHWLPGDAPLEQNVAAVLATWHPPGDLPAQ